MDNATGTFRRLDSVRTVVARDTLRKGSYLTGTMELPLGAGRWTVRVLVAQPGRPVGSAFELPTPARFAASGLFLSDIVPGRAGSGLAWAGPNGAVPLNPLGVFPSGGSAELYSEAGGQRPGATYHTTIELRRRGDTDARHRVHVEFTYVAAAPWQPMRRTIGLDGVEAGRYTLRLVLRDAATGRQAAREMPLDVVNR